MMDKFTQLYEAIIGEGKISKTILNKIKHELDDEIGTVQEVFIDKYYEFKEPALYSNLFDMKKIYREPGNNEHYYYIKIK